VSQPRIAVFARMANGDAAPVRVIEGQKTKLSRTMHGIAYDPVHDEIVVPVALAGAVLVFRGDTSGDESPLRIIQGEHTRLLRPHTVAVDSVHGEIVVGESSGRGLLIYDRRANGDTPPLRAIGGPKTGLHLVTGVGVDPVHNLIVASSTSHVGGQTGLFIFNRTDNGDVAPRAIITGPHTGIVRPWQIAIDPSEGRIFVALINNNYYSPYQLDHVRKELHPGAVVPDPWHTGKLGLIAVWNITDSGDVPPRAIIKGPATDLTHPAGVAIDPKDGEVFATDSVRNGLFMFSVPRFFQKLLERGP
jgi:DNA-binding beta-propeller fold protein YncE